MSEERVAVELEEEIIINTSLQNFRGWLESYLKASYPRATVLDDYDSGHPDADVLVYGRFGGYIRIRVLHLKAEELKLFLYGFHIPLSNGEQTYRHLEELKDAIEMRWNNSRDDNSMNNSIPVNIFSTLLQEVSKLPYEDAQTTGVQLSKRIQSAISKYFGNENSYLTEYNKVKNRFYSQYAAEYNRLEYFERDKRETIGILNRILDDIQLDGIPQKSNYFLDANPIFGEPLAEDSDDWADVFVIMPFASAFTHIYKQHIHDSVINMGLTCRRGDEFSSTNVIIDEIWSSIIYSKFCIADCTGKNPNVFYEIGVAHTLGKECILVTQSMNDIPFNVGHRRIIVYTPSPEGLIELSNKLKETIKSLI